MINSMINHGVYHLYRSGDYAGHIHQKEENLKGHLSVLPDINDRILM